MKGINLIVGMDMSIQGTYEDDFVKRDEHLRQIQEDGILEVIEPKKGQVFVDIDSDDDYDEFINRFSYIEHYIGKEFTIDEYISKSGYPNRHIIVQTPFLLTPMATVALQQALNSDPMKDFLSICRILNNERQPNVLFRPIIPIKHKKEIDNDCPF